MVDTSNLGSWDGQWWCGVTQQVSDRRNKDETQEGRIDDQLQYCTTWSGFKLEQHLLFIGGHHHIWMNKHNNVKIEQPNPQSLGKINTYYVMGSP